MRIDYDKKIDQIVCNNKDDFRRINSLIRNLTKELDTFDYGGDYQNLSHFLFEIGRELPFLPLKKQKIINGELIKLHSSVRNLIVNKPNYISKDDPNYLELKSIINSIEGFDLSLLYNFLNEYDGNCYNLIKYLIFDQKNITFFNYALSKYPHLFNIRDENNDCILSLVVDEYLSSIKKFVEDNNIVNNDELLFYDEVLESLLSNSSFNYISSLQEELLGKVLVFLDEYDFSNTNRSDKEKIIYWTNLIKNRLEGREIVETIDDLSYKTDIDFNFSPAIISEVNRYKVFDFKSEMDRREYITDEYIITADGEGAEEIDDGLSCKRLSNGNFLLGVHISDPLGYINRDSILFDEAGRRTTSIYDPVDPSIPMFPEYLSKDIMSLTQDEPRFATSYYLEITPKGEILYDKCVIKKTVVNVNKTLTYDSFNYLHKHGCNDDRLMETFDSLQRVSDLLSRRILIDENYKIVNRESGNISGTNIVGNTNSERIVEYAMIACNHTVSSIAKKKGIPFVYRGHELSSDYLKKMDYYDSIFKDNPTKENYYTFVKMLKANYPTAFYTTDSSIGHQGLNLNDYCHITSPLRRFADCLNSVCLEEFYFKSDSSLDKESFTSYLDEQCKYINDKKRTIDYFSKSYSKVLVKKNN